jgi:hypothetical protein
LTWHRGTARLLGLYPEASMANQIKATGRLDLNVGRVQVVSVNRLRGSVTLHYIDAAGVRNDLGDHRRGDSVAIDGYIDLNPRADPPSGYGFTQFGGRPLRVEDVDDPTWPAVKLWHPDAER